MGTETERSGVHITGADSGWPVGGDAEPGPKKDGTGKDKNPVAVETQDAEGPRKIDRPDGPSATEPVAGVVKTKGSVNKPADEVDYPTDLPLPEGEEEAASRGDSGGTTSSYESRTVTELRSLAKERGIAGYSKLKKPELIDQLRS